MQGVSYTRINKCKELPIQGEINTRNFLFKESKDTRLFLTHSFQVVLFSSYQEHPRKFNLIPWIGKRPLGGREKNFTILITFAK